MYTLSILVISSRIVWAEVGACTYEDDSCSCKFGDSTTGICFDRDFSSTSSGSGLPCTSRYCHAGWSCSCQGRTHLCHIKDRKALIPDTSARSIGSSTTCHEEFKSSADHPNITLGVFKPSYSRKGLEAKKCNKLAWWLNGELMGNYGEETADLDVDEILQQRAVNTLLELRRGDLIAFRFKASSYHCYNSYSTFIVNETSIDTKTSGVTTHFSRGFVPDWFTKDGKVTFASEEKNASITDFVPLRTNALLDNATIVFGDDSWARPGGSPDDAISNFYFRIQL